MPIRSALLDSGGLLVSRLVALYTTPVLFSGFEAHRVRRRRVRRAGIGIEEAA